MSDVKAFVLKYKEDAIQAFHYLACTIMLLVLLFQVFMVVLQLTGKVQLTINIYHQLEKIFN